MKNRKPVKILRHSFTMVTRTLRAYSLLSVTIVLSFSLLLGYLLLTDSTLYNRYKKVFQSSRETVVAFDYSYSPSRITALMEKATAMDNTYAQLVYMTYGNFEYSADGVGNVGSSAYLQGIPAHSWGYYEPGYDEILRPVEITWLDGKDRADITLTGEEALMDRETFYLLGLDQMEEPHYTISLASTLETPVTLTVRIVGLIENRGSNTKMDAMGNPIYHQQIALSVDVLNPLDIPTDFWQITFIFYTGHPEEVTQFAEDMGFQAASVYEWQNEALEAIRYEKKNKAIIAIALLVLLGINLYSSFSNALNERKFEIGVKRAIGASAWSIVRQFLYESLIVMAANIFISVVLVTDIFIVYKYILEHTPNESGEYRDWILYISPHSIAMFAVCTLSLTIVFSLIFAYKSTRVEIVRYLKAE